MQTLRKKTSPCKYKNEPSRFLGEGVSFKAKLIGILEVSEARGDRMCQEALADLKMAIRAAGEHKQRITIHVAIDGLRLRDEKTGDSLYHHPVHKISFIAQDMSDSRAFGYIFGSPDTGHRFFGIKTDKAASQVVIAMRDLFQVVFELKKKEIELAKQHLEHKTYSGTSKTGYLADSHISSKMSIINESSGTSKSPTGAVLGLGAIGEAVEKGAVGGPPAEAIADLVDLELELSSIQQGIHQMERITPSDPFGPNKEDPFNSDPFGDSFTSFPKPFLPPPPSSKDRSSRTTNVNNTSTDSGSMFSPRPGLLSTSSETSQSRQDSSMFESPEETPDWFPSNSTGTNEKSTTSTETTNEKTKHEETKNSILAQFDVFTELDPLGTGKSKPYVDKKLFFQELKNPPKKVLKDLVPVTTTATSDSKLFQANFEAKTDSSTFPIDPFADEDPFDKTDPFSEEFKPAPQDPFNTDFIVDFKMYSKQELKPIPSGNPPPSSESKELIDSLKFPPLESILGNSTSASFENNLFNSSSLSKSPVRGLERQVSMATTTSSPKSLFSKQNTFDCKFDFHDKKKEMPLLHENPSLDMSSESESMAPEPPPRPASNITPTIKPPPLPPKKQLGDLSVKPPPRPPHTDIECHYDYIVDSGPNSLDSIDKSPPLPVPARKSAISQRSEWESSSQPPQRPQKTISSTSSQEDYLTPVPPPTLHPMKRRPGTTIRKGQFLPPPPQKKDSQKRKQLQTKVDPPVETTSQPDISDITLTDLTTSGVDKLAKKLNVPAAKLSNMTLVELTAFLQEYISSAKKQNQSQSEHRDKVADITFPAFKAEFSMNFSDFNDSTKVTNSTANSTSFDRYAVFRELLEKEEEKERQSELMNPVLQSSLSEENENIEEEINDNNVTPAVSLTDEIPVKDTNPSIDRYAALREIVVEDLVVSEEKELNIDQDENENDANESKNEQNNLNLDSNKQENSHDNDLDLFQCVDSKLVYSSEKLNEADIIEYSKPIELEMNDIGIKDQDKEVISKSKSSPTLNQPALPLNDTNNVQLTSGSLSDAISGSSPEIDNGESPEMKPKETPAESWAIFDNPKKEKPQEDGLSPWSSDSKEFPSNAAPSNEDRWRHQRKASPGSGSDNVPRAKHKSKEKEVSGRWWDDVPKSREIREKYGGHQPARDDRERHRRSTDSYEEEYEVERSYHGNRDRRVKPRQTRWNRGHPSSSSRDVSPWEEEPCRDWNVRRRGPSSSRRSRDSWDEEDDYEYDQPEQWDRRSGSRDRDRHYGRRPPIEDVWSIEDRRHGPSSRRRYRPPVETEHHCCGDWGEQDSDVGYANEPNRFTSGSRHHEWRDRDRNRDDERYYPRTNRPQELPWEDEYGNDPDDESPNGRTNYVSSKRSWKRPSSASEMDRKTGENKSRQNPYHTMGPTTGSDGERERRYKTTGRRAKSRDSENTYNHRHKIDPMLTLRHRNRDKLPKSPFEDDFSEQSIDTPSPKVKYEFNMMKPTKKSLTSPKSDLESPHSNQPSRNKHSPKVEPSNRFKFDDFENDIEPPGVSFDEEQIRPEKDYSNTKKKFFENDFFENDFQKNRESLFDSSEFVAPVEKERERVSPRLKKSSMRQDSQFEDDFSPSDKSLTMTGGDSINSIAEELPEGGVPASSSTTSGMSKSVNFSSDTKKWMRSSFIRKFPGQWRGDLNIKKSESVNIFARENDPFDDDFFSKPENGSGVARDGKAGANLGSNSAASTNDASGVQWTEDFDCFDVIEEN